MLLVGTRSYRSKNSCSFKSKEVYSLKNCTENIQSFFRQGIWTCICSAPEICRSGPVDLAMTVYDCCMLRREKIMFEMHQSAAIAKQRKCFQEENVFELSRLGHKTTVYVVVAVQTSVAACALCTSVLLSSIWTDW